MNSESEGTAPPTEAAMAECKTEQRQIETPGPVPVGTEALDDSVPSQQNAEPGTSFSSTGDSKNTTKQKLLTRVAHSDGHFKSQQRGEPDLTFQEKFDIAQDVLTKKPATFLSRFGQYLVAEDLSFFDDMRGDYMIDFHMKEILNQLDKRQNKTVVRNRRYEAMQQMMSEGSYFR